MMRESNVEYYLNVAKEVSKRSTCLKRQYGCIIVNNDEIIATGYNGSPRGEINCCDVYDVCPRLHKEHNSGDYSDCPAVHAEQNAMLSASRRDMIDATLYLSGYDVVSKREIMDPKPCPICTRMIKNSGISQVVNKTKVYNVEDL